MTNREIAAVLEEVGTILEIKGENAFKVRSYYRAAETIGHSGITIGETTTQDDLRRLEGIGQAISDKILEIAATGTCAYREELLADFPRGLLDVIKVPGVGPKKAALFHEQLGVSDLDSLEAAAKAGALADLPRMGEKSQQKILAGIATVRAAHGRMLLSEAESVALRVLAHLPEAAQAVAAGSLRRGKETVGDIDILAQRSERADPMAAFLSMPEVAEVLRQGDTRSSVMLHSGPQVDLRVVEPESMGAALQYFTGSQQHNIRLRERAGERGLRLNEYGVFDQSEAQLAGATEEDVYAALELAWIPPEMREDRGEVKLAAEGALPALVEPADIRGDLQMHSTASDGAHTIRQMAEAARERGLEYIAITDHSKSLGVANGLDEGRLREQIAEIRALNEELAGITVLASCEVEILGSGDLDLDDDVLAELDIVLACMHSGLGGEAATVTQRLIKAARHPLVHVIGHPTGRLIGQREGASIDLEALFAACVECGTALEINSGPQRLDLSDADAREAIGHGVLLTVGTDAHSAESLDWMRHGVTTARRAWATRDNILNARPLAELREWLDAKRRTL